MTESSTEPGDWTGLGMLWQVPGVTPDTPRPVAARMIGRWLILEMLECRGPPPGWTETEYLDYLALSDSW